MDEGTLMIQGQIRSARRPSSPRRRTRQRLHRCGWGVAAFVVLAALLVVAPATPTEQARATVAVETGITAMQFAQVVMADPSILTGAQWVSQPSGLSAARTSVSLSGMPTEGSSFGVISTGNASIVDEPEVSTSSNLGGGAVRLGQERDVTVLRIDFTVPPAVNCMVGLDFRFLSREFPTYVGQNYNDAFIAELDESTWTATNAGLSAPRNFAFDPNNQPITINAAGASSMSAPNAAGTSYGGATPLLTARTPITPGAHSLFLSVFDQGDSDLDSVVMIDNIDFGAVRNPVTDCRQGVEPVGEFKYIALGDGFSSGEGLAPYFDPRNKCHRSPLAFPFFVEVPDQVGTRVRDRGPGFEWGFQACSGAGASHLIRGRKWGDPIGQLALLRDRDKKNQFDLPVDGATDVVTLSTGSEDVGMRAALAFCATSADCSTAAYKGRTLSADWERSLTAFAPKLLAALAAIDAQAPDARVLVLGYPLLFPADVDQQDCAGLEQVTQAGTGLTLGYTNAEQDLLRSLIGDLNDTIADAVTTSGVGVFVGTNARFDDHEVCGSDGARIGGPVIEFPPRRSKWTMGDAAFHPTACGQRTLAAIVNATLHDETFVDPGC